MYIPKTQCYRPTETWAWQGPGLTEEDHVPPPLAWLHTSGLRACLSGGQEWWGKIELSTRRCFVENLEPWRSPPGSGRVCLLHKISISTPAVHHHSPPPNTTQYHPLRDPPPTLDTSESTVAHHASQ